MFRLRTSRGLVLESRTLIALAKCPLCSLGCQNRAVTMIARSQAFAASCLQDLARVQGLGL